LDDRSFGIVCVAQTEERRRWGWEDQFYLNQFVPEFLSPLMAESRRSRDKVRGHLIPTRHEARSGLPTLPLDVGNYGDTH
jgi:hypothetical protein